VRKLHLVGFTSDRKGLIYSARRGSKSGGFLVPIEDSLVARIEEVTRGPNGDDAAADATPQPIVAPVASAPGRPRSQSALTPREMQSRLRAGRTIAEVAAEAKADPEWVERFAIPILAEQAQMVELARSLTYVKPRRGESAEPLGPSVAENLIDRGVQLLEDQFDAAWSAYQLHDVVWVVRVRYRSRGRLQEAAWEVNVATGQLTSRNRLASDLGFVDKGRRRRPAPRIDATGGPVEVPADSPITRRASPSRSRAAADGEARAPAAKARRPARKRTKKAATATRPKAAKRPSSPSIARAPSSSKAKPAARTKSTATTRSAAAKSKSATTKARPAAKATKANKAKKKAVGRAASPAKKARSVTTATRPATRSRAAVPTKRLSTAARRAKATKRSGGARPRARKAAAAEKPPGSVGPARANGSPPAPTGLRGQSPPSGPGSGTNGEEPPEGRPRVPINRLAANRVAASRAAAARLVDDRRAANPVPPSEADAATFYRPARAGHAGGPSRSGPAGGPSRSDRSARAAAPDRAVSPSRPTHAAPPPPRSPRLPAAAEVERPAKPRKPSVADLVFEDLLEDEPPERPWGDDAVTTGERPVIAAPKVGSGGGRSPGERTGRDAREPGTSSPWPLRTG
jgi:Protein of unknown function (DUF3071)